MDSVSIMNITQSHIKKELDTALHSQDLYVKITNFSRAKGIFDCSLDLLSDTECAKMLDWWIGIKKTYFPLFLKALETIDIETGDF